MTMSLTPQPQYIANIHNNSDYILIKCKRSDPFESTPYQIFLFNLPFLFLLNLSINHKIINPFEIQKTQSKTTPPKNGKLKIDINRKEPANNLIHLAVYPFGNSFSPRI